MPYFGVYRASGSVTTWSAHARYTLLISGLDDRNPAGPEDSLRRWVAVGEEEDGKNALEGSPP